MAVRTIAVIGTFIVIAGCASTQGPIETEKPYAITTFDQEEIEIFYYLSDLLVSNNPPGIRLVTQEDGRTFAVETQNTFVVLADVTSVQVGGENINDHAETIRSFLVNDGFPEVLDDALMGSFIAKNDQHYLINIPESTTLVKESTVGLEPRPETLGYWRNFAELATDAAVRLTYSRVGFNEARDVALISVIQQYSEVYSRGSFIILKKNHWGNWVADKFHDFMFF